jgi:GNAT superfamily N-acetyltransferase
MLLALTLPVLAVGVVSASLATLSWLSARRARHHAPGGHDLPAGPSSRRLAAPHAGLTLRPARTSEADRLSELAFQSKGHWRYPADQLAAWRPALTISPADIERGCIQVAEVNAAVAGFFSLRQEAGVWYLDHLWVAPGHMGRGVGRALLQHAAHLASRFGAEELRVYSEPRAEGFYRALGAERLGFVEAPTPDQPKRALPLLAVPVPHDPELARRHDPAPGTSPRRAWMRGWR